MIQKVTIYLLIISFFSGWAFGENATQDAGPEAGEVATSVCGGHESEMQAALLHAVLQHLGLPLSLKDDPQSE